MLFDFSPEAQAALESLPKAQRKALKGQMKNDPQAVARFLERRGFETVTAPCDTCYGDDHARVERRRLSEQEVQSKLEAGW